MKRALHLYSDILTFREEAYRALKRLPAGLPLAIAIFMVATLLMGGGLWLRLPAELRRPSPADRIATTARLVGRVDRALSPETGDRPLTVALTSGRTRSFASLLGIDGPQLETAAGRLEAIPRRTLEMLNAAEATVNRLEPPIGVRISRAFEFFGSWLSTPFAVAARYLPVALVAVFVARLLGGRATLRQHLTAMLVCAAPAFLLFLWYAGDLSAGMPLTAAYGVRVAGRIMAILGIAWSAAILVKSLAIAHEFTYARSLATLALAYGAVYVVWPLLGLSQLLFLLRP